MSYRQIARDGLWSNNPALVQVIGLCPLLATSNSAINGLSLGLATLLVLLGSNSLIALLRAQIPQGLRIPIFVLLIASLVGAIELLLKAFSPELYQRLGIFIALIVTNCLIMARAEAFAYRKPWSQASWDGLMQGLGFMWVLGLLGAVRELLATGGIFGHAQQLWGDWAAGWSWQWFQLDNPLLLALLPPGAFIGLGLLIAAKNAIDLQRAARRQPVSAPSIARVRITGEL